MSSTGCMLRKPDFKSRRIGLGRMQRGITGQEFCCSFEGKHKTKVGDDRKTTKTSKRDGCKGMVYARTAGDGGRTFFTRIVF